MDIPCDVVLDDEGTECGAPAVQLLRFLPEGGGVALCGGHLIEGMASELTPEEYRALNR